MLIGTLLEDLEAPLREMGRQVIASLHTARGFPVLHQTKPDWGVVQNLIRELSGPKQARHLNRIARESFQANAGNAREVFRSCYWACARR